MRGKVRCMDCGYLQMLKPDALWEQTMRNGKGPSSFLEAGSELSNSAREKVKQRSFSHVASMSCYRKADPPGIDHPIPLRDYERRIYNGCLQYQDCRLFFPYSPGHSPREHLQHHDDMLKALQARRWTQKLSLILLAAVLLGLAFGILARPYLENAFHHLFG